MKIKFSIISAGGLLSGLAICPFTPASAIEPPADTATPPAALLRENHPAPTPVADNTAFLGIATAVVPGMLAEHLDLRNDTGVIVRTVCPDSPAEKAGLAVNDVLTTLDGKEIASPDSFSAGRH